MSPLVPGLLALGSFVLALAGIVLLRDRGLLWRFAAEEAGAEPAGRRRAPMAGAFEALGDRVGPTVWRLLGPARIARLRRRLDAAGRPLTVEQYAKRKGALTACSTLVAVVLALRGSWILVPVFPILGWIWIDMYINRMGRLRQARIERDLPDFLDILSVCVGAGIAFRPSMARVADAVGGPLGDEVTLSLRQLSLGATRREAFEGLRARNPAESLGQFVSHLLQAEELGVPLVDALVDLARDMRRIFQQQARQRAARAGPRIALIVTLLIVPGAMLLMIAGLFFGTNIHLGAAFGG